jgi:hypothetical protein
VWTKLTGCYLLIVISSVASAACDPPPSILDKVTASSVVRDATFTYSSDDLLWRKLQEERSPFQAPAMLRCGMFEFNVDVASLAGAPALGIRVTALRPLPTTANRSEEELWSEAVETILKVWAGEFRSAGAEIGWQEGAFWSISAVINYANGRQGSLLTDGVHVKLKDSQGRDWFLRLLPAAQ